MARPIRTATIAALCAAALLALGAWILSPGPIVRDPPRNVPWVLPDHRLAKKQVEYLESGALSIRVEHALLPGVSPQMLAWFYRQLPISTMEYQGVTRPLYHFFHPSEHGEIWVEEPADDGLPGMGPGSVVARNEWFGPYDSRGAAQIVEFSDAGILAIARIAGIQFGEIRHVFTDSEGGTLYTLEAVIGSDLPVIGPLINWYLRTRIYHPEMVSEWLRHQVEEVSSLQYFLPQIYQQRDTGNHFVLGDCVLTGPNLLLDPDFSLEARDPVAGPWHRTMHAGQQAYEVEFANSELTISKFAAQEWLYISQRVRVGKYKGRKMAFSAELKLDLSPTPGLPANASGGGLDVIGYSGAGNILWSSRRNHEPRIGTTDWRWVQVVLKIPPITRYIDAMFIHEAEGTLQIRNPSLRLVDESKSQCEVTPDNSAQYQLSEDPPLR